MNAITQVWREQLGLPMSWQIDQKATKLITKDFNNGLKVIQRAHKSVQKKELGMIFIAPKLVIQFILIDGKPGHSIAPQFMGINQSNSRLPYLPQLGELFL